MGLFASSIAAVGKPGVFPIEVASPTIIDGVSNGLVGLDFQGEWGPVNQTYVPTSGGDMINTYFPPGSPHNSTGYYATMRRKKVPWAMTRILGGNQGLLPPVVTAVVAGTPGATSNTYVVVAKNAAGATVRSNVVVVTNCNATLSGGNKVTLTWAAVTGATSYDVYRTVSGGTPSTVGKIGNTAGTTIDDTGLAGDTTTAPTANTSGWAQAVCYLQDAAGNTVGILIAKYAGTLPNGGRMTATVAAATDGVANHFKLTVQMVDAVTGTSSELYDGAQVQATAILPVLTTSNLLAAMVLPGTPTTRPANGTYNFEGGSNGLAVTANDYNTGLTQLALNQSVRVVSADDCGDSIRAAVNVNVQAHVDATTNRIGVIQGNPGNTWAQNLTDVANYRDDRIIYSGAWVQVNDDVGIPQQSPFTTFIASAISNLEPQQSHAWWDDRVTDYYTGIAAIPATLFSTADDLVQTQATQQGICLPIRLDSGRYAALHDRTTSLTANKQFAVTRRIKDYLAISIKQGIPSWVNGPNAVDDQRRLNQTLGTFLDEEVRKGRLTSVDGTAPAYTLDTKTPNTIASLNQGKYAVLINGHTPPPMEDIFILMNTGPQTQVTAF